MKLKMNKIDVKKFGKVVVLMGGQSAEREVSLSSGKGILAALLRKGVDAHAIDVGADIVAQLQKGNFDSVFNILHGRGGEDGVIQEVLEFLNIAYPYKILSSQDPLTANKLLNPAFCTSLKLFPA